MTRLRAFRIHLTTCFIVLLILLGLTWFIWYPAPYFETEGGWKMLGFLAAVGFVLGPLLTLIVFKPGKSGLKFDMICILFMQLGIFLYGGTAIYRQRPAFIVFAVDRFVAVPVSEVDLTNLQHPELKNATEIRPRFVQARLPEDIKVQQDFTFNVLSGQERDIEFHPEFYEAYRPDFQQLRSRNIDIQRIKILNAEAKQAIDRFIKQQGGGLEDYLYLPFKGKMKDIVMVLSLKDGLPVGFIGISPWLVDYPATRQ